MEGVVLIGLGALSLWWVLFRGNDFARKREQDRSMPWIGSWQPYGWTRKAFAALPLPVDRAVQATIAVLMIAGGIWWVAR